MREALDNPYSLMKNRGSRRFTAWPVHIASKWLDQAVNPDSVTTESKCFLKGSHASAVLSLGQLWTHMKESSLRVRPAKTKWVACPFKSQALSHSGLENEEQSWRNHAAWHQTILQGYGNQNSLVLAWKQKHRSMEQNREPRNKLTPLQSINIWQNRQKHAMG